MSAPVLDALTLRFAFPDDECALALLAALDSRRVPAPPLLVAESGEELLAALSLADGGLIADPFVPTLAVIALLRARAAQLEAADRPPGLRARLARKRAGFSAGRPGDRRLAPW